MRGRYVTSGAIAGPIIEPDLRTLYLKDQILIDRTCESLPIWLQMLNAAKSARSWPTAMVCQRVEA